MRSVPLFPLPASPAVLVDADWAALAPYYSRLAEMPIDRHTAEAWLATWSTLDELVGEAMTAAEWAYTRDTTDAEAEATHLRWTSEIGPELDAATTRLADRAVTLGITRPGLEPTLAGWRTDIALYRDANKPRFAALEELAAEYQKVAGSLTATWGGRTVPVAQLAPFTESNERAVREAAYRAGTAAVIENRGRMARIFDQMVPLRDAIAREADCSDFMAYSYSAMHRSAYTPDDVARWCDAVEAVVVPAVERLRNARRESLGVPKLRPWDLAVSTSGRTALRPFADAEALVAGGERILSAIDPTLAHVLPTLRAAGLLDLKNRTGKAPGAFCTEFAHRRLPAIFMNAVGIADDVMTLLHEAGHAAHALHCGHLPLAWTRHPGMEAAELASMSLELLALPHLAMPTGFYNAADAARAEYEHLEAILSFFPHCASVDRFQRWVYTEGCAGDAGARDAAWLRIRERFEPGVDWTGLESERVARWYQQHHIFECPFYYIEYGLAQLGALQVWRNAQRDQNDAVRRYTAALSLGNTADLRTIYQAAGARLVFDAVALQELVTLVEERLAVLREHLQPPGVRATV